MKRLLLIALLLISCGGGGTIHVSYDPYHTIYVDNYSTHYFYQADIYDIYGVAYVSADIPPYTYDYPLVEVQSGFYDIELLCIYGDSVIFYDVYAGGDLVLEVW